MANYQGKGLLKTAQKQISCDGSIQKLSGQHEGVPFQMA